MTNAGFYIYRSETKEDEFNVVNPTMVQGAGTTGKRNEYTWTDTTAKPNTVYFYQIEDVSHAGERKRLATVRLKGLVSASGKLIPFLIDNVSFFVAHSSRLCLSPLHFLTADNERNINRNGIMTKWADLKDEK